MHCAQGPEQSLRMGKIVKKVTGIIQCRMDVFNANVDVGAMTS